MATKPTRTRAIGNEISTTLSSSITDVATSITVADATGMNTDGGYIIIDEGISNKEEVLYVESITSNTLTISSNGRGLAGTTAVAHDAGATVTDILVEDHVNGIIDSMDNEHNDDGTHSDITATTIAVGNTTITGTLGVTGASTLTGNLTVNSGDLVIDDGQDIKFDSGAKIERTSGHILITPETSKMVAITVLRHGPELGGGTAYRNGSVILSGWHYNQTSNAYTSQTVSFGITLNQVPIVLMSFIGYKVGGTPASINDFDAGGTSLATAAIPVIRSQTTSSFLARLVKADGTAMDSADSWGFNWAAIGKFIT